MHSGGPETTPSLEDVATHLKNLVQTHSEEVDGIRETKRVGSRRLRNVALDGMAIEPTRIEFTVTEPEDRNGQPSGNLHYGLTLFENETGEEDDEVAIYAISWTDVDGEFLHGLGQDNFKRPANPGKVDRMISSIYLWEHEGSMTPME